MDWPLPPTDVSVSESPWQNPSLAKRSELFLIGKHGGLLPYFPFALIALMLFAFRRQRLEGGLILLGFLIACWSIPPLSSDVFAREATGNPALLPLYPAFLFLLGHLGLGRVGLQDSSGHYGQQQQRHQPGTQARLHNGGRGFRS